MRTGANPAKAGLPAYSPKRLGIVTIVYIPLTEGYYANSIQILKYMLESIRANTPEEFDLLVFDNGSCPAAVAELESLYQNKSIDWLFLSQRNLGKAGAWNWIFGAMPNELICYADSDVLFRRGWLEASLEILAAFPQAGMIGAQPNFFDVMEGAGQAHLQALASGAFQSGEYWPSEATIEEYCFGIGASDELADRFRQSPLPSLINQSGEQAVLGASHMQFLIPRRVARLVVPLPATKALYRKETMSLDYKIDELGLLHVSALEPYVFHMGNTINERLLAEVERALSAQAAGPGKPGAGKPGTQQSPLQATTPPIGKQKPVERWLGRIVRHKRLNSYFLRLYNLLFKLLHDSE